MSVFDKDLCHLCVQCADAPGPLLRGLWVERMKSKGFILESRKAASLVTSSREASNSQDPLEWWPHEQEQRAAVKTCLHWNDFCRAFSCSVGKMWAATAHHSSAGLPQGAGTHLLCGVSQDAGGVPHNTLLTFQIMKRWSYLACHSCWRQVGTTAGIILSQSSPLWLRRKVQLPRYSIWNSSFIKKNPLEVISFIKGQYIMT